jgi:four helix bundle protein
MMREHHKPIVWRESRNLVKETYSLTGYFSKSERFGLVAQMRRAAVSIPSNIAEGAARATTREFCHFLSIARGSLSGLEKQLIVSEDPGLINEWSDIKKLIEQLFGRIGGLVNQQKSRISEESGLYDALAPMAPHPSPLTPHGA